MRRPCCQATAWDSWCTEIGEDARRRLRELGVAEVDLTVLEEAVLELRAAVVRDGQLTARLDEPRRVRFEVETMSRWFDVRRAIRDQDQAYLARVNREGLG